MPSSNAESHLVLLRLRPIKEALRPNEWHTRKEKVLATAHRMISESLNSDDAYTIHGEETCMIAFAKISAEQAEVTASEIGDRIVRSLFGEIGAATFPLLPRVLAVRDLLPNIGSGEPDDPLQGIMTGPGAGPLSELTSKPPEEMRKDEQKNARRRKLLELFEPERPAEIVHEYRPIWCVDDQTVHSFRYYSCLPKSSADCLIGYAVLGPDYTEAELVDLDIQSVENALIDLKRAIDSGHDVRLSLSVHFETVGSNHGRSELIKILPILPTSFRKRISFTMEGVPEGVPEGRLQEVVSVLKPFSDSRAIILDPVPTNGRVLKGMIAKAKSVGLDTICVRLPLDAAYSDLKDVCSVVLQITSMGLKAAVFRVTTGDEVAELTTTGCSILAGSIFGGPFKGLPKPYSLRLSSFEGPAGKLKVTPFLLG